MNDNSQEIYQNQIYQSFSKYNIEECPKIKTSSSKKENTEFTFKKGEALMTIVSATSAQIIGYNFSARLVDGNWIGENNDYIEQLNFSMVSGGFDYVLDLTVNPDLQSTDIIIDCNLENVTAAAVPASKCTKPVRTNRIPMA